MSMIKKWYHDEINKLPESEDPYDRDWITEEDVFDKLTNIYRWKQNMYKHREALTWLESIVRKNQAYQRDNEGKDNE